MPPAKLKWLILLPEQYCHCCAGSIGDGDGATKVAVFDFDVHHGNGTEDVLLNHPGAAFYSVHQFPCYPGTGQKNVGNNCFNYPVFPSTPRESWRATLARALDDMKTFSPKLMAVSAGFDAYERDPLAQGTLQPLKDFFLAGTATAQHENPLLQPAGRRL